MLPPASDGLRKPASPSRIPPPKFLLSVGRRTTQGGCAGRTALLRPGPSRPLSLPGGQFFRLPQRGLFTRSPELCCWSSVAGGSVRGRKRKCSPAVARWRPGGGGGGSSRGGARHGARDGGLLGVAADATAPASAGCAAGAGLSVHDAGAGTGRCRAGKGPPCAGWGGGQAGQGGSERAGSPWEFCGVFRLPALRLPALVNDPGRLGAAAHLRPGPEQRDPSVYECWGRGARCIPALPL